MRGTLSDASVVCVANAEWDWPCRLNCHHIASRMAAMGVKDVLFVETIGARRVSLGGARDLRKIYSRLIRSIGGIRTVDKGLRVLSPLAVPNRSFGLLQHINVSLVGLQVRRALAGQMASARIVWTFAPMLGGLGGRIKRDLLVYHCVDDHGENPGVDRAGLALAERAVVKKADVVFATSRRLYDRLRYENDNTYYMPNVADARHFARALDPALAVPPDVARIPRPLAMFIGNVSAYKVDISLLARLAELRPDWNFVLLGPRGIGETETDITSLLAHPNVWWLGPKNYADVPAYLRIADVCLLPMRTDGGMESSFPMKFFEYLAAGKRVIGVPMNALAEHRALYDVAASAEEFAVRLDVAGRTVDSRATVEGRIRAAEESSWERRIKDLLVVVERHLQRKGRCGA